MSPPRAPFRELLFALKVGRGVSEIALRLLQRGNCFIVASDQVTIVEFREEVHSFESLFVTSHRARRAARQLLVR